MFFKKLISVVLPFLYCLKVLLLVVRTIQFITSKFISSAVTNLYDLFSMKILRKMIFYCFTNDFEWSDCCLLQYDIWRLTLKFLKLNEHPPEKFRLSKMFFFLNFFKRPWPILYIGMVISKISQSELRPWKLSLWSS